MLRILFALCAFVALSSATQTRAPALETFLRAEARERDRDFGPKLIRSSPHEDLRRGLLRYRANWADLNGDGRKEAIVLIQSTDWCGTGGCQMYLLMPEGAGYRVVSVHTIVNMPVLLLETRTKGWRDIAVRSRFDAFTSHMARLRFDGDGYPSNPSVPPAVEIRNPKGRILLGADTPERILKYR